MSCPKCKTGFLIKEKVYNSADDHEEQPFVWQIKCVNCGFRYEKFAFENRKTPHAQVKVKYRRYTRKFNIRDMEK